MKTLLVFLNSGLFFVIAAIHIYWAMGGKWASQAVIPVNPAKSDTVEKAVFRPSVVATLIVASGLMAFSFILFNVLLQKTQLVDYQEVMLNVIAGIFLVRTVGDYKYVGFFKKIRNTRFAINDTKLFSPLCLWLSTSTIYINYH